MNGSGRSPKAWHFVATSAPPGTKLPSGGAIPPYGHIGHWEVTGKVIEEMGFSAPGANILCDAAQDPDFYDFGTVSAHAQTPDGADSCGNKEGVRQSIIERAIDDYLAWVNAQFRKSAVALEKGDERLSLYWLGYALHGVEDLAVHQGITNGEHGAAKESPDYNAANVALSYVYARRMLDAVRNALGQEAFDRLRNYVGSGKLTFFEKHRKGVHPKGWDIDNHLNEYWSAGKQYEKIKPKPEPVRWDREYVLSGVLEKISDNRIQRVKALSRTAPTKSSNPHRRFEILTPLVPLSKPAEWTILVYMAGDDCNPQSIEYAISQDLTEIKKVGSTDQVHFLAQTDDATGSASYRYRLRKETDLESDRIERFNGDLNTGSTKTLVDFVKWGTKLFPSKHVALILWGHGSGHDDQNIYRAVRGSVNPRTAARLAKRRLGFFSGTKRSLLEQGPTRGYGYDDTAGDFLDNGELRKALKQIAEITGRKLDILGFDACLMAMIEVAYQIHDAVRILVASERTEPGDGWWYNRAFGRLVSDPAITPRELSKDMVRAYREGYDDEMTLSAIDLSKIPTLAGHITSWATTAQEASYHVVRRSALDCSPRPGDGYCDLGSFLEAASSSTHKGFRHAASAFKALKSTVVASCGKASGLTIYAPGNFTPHRAGSTDALYLGLAFARETGWGRFLQKVYPRAERAAAEVEMLPIPTPVAGLDRYNARHVLAAVRSGAKKTWIDRLRSEVLGPYRHVTADRDDIVAQTAKQIDKLDPPKDTIKSPPARKKGPSPEEKRRILILPGIMGSLLHDRSGKLGGVWIDPWNLVFGNDFEELKLTWQSRTAIKERLRLMERPNSLPTRIPDADDAVSIEAYGVVPLVYDRMALALMHEFGPIVEYAPFDWRQPIDFLGEGLANRVKALLRECRGIEVSVVAHSMGGLVAAAAFKNLQVTSPSSLEAVKRLVVLGTPFLGSISALQALRVERDGMGLLELLTRKGRADLTDTVQTFRGLRELLPGDQDDLLKCPVFAPGPLSRLSPEDERLHAPLSVIRDLPPDIKQRTCAIICTARNTPGSAKVREDGSIDYSNTVAGDGTVSGRSALRGGDLIGQNAEVNEGHMTLPLNGKAIEHTVDWIAQGFGVRTPKPFIDHLPAAPQIVPPGSAEELVRHLDEAEDDFTLGDFMALISLM